MDGVSPPFSDAQSLGILRNRSVGWVVNAIREVNNQELILKSFELCRVGPFNLSHASISSPKALAALRNLPKTNPALYNEFTNNTDDTHMAATADIPDEPAFSDLIEDASDIPIDIVIQHVNSGSLAVAPGFALDDDGGLVRSATIEDPDLEVEEGNTMGSVLGRGHRSKRPPGLFGGVNSWWEH